MAADGGAVSGMQPREAGKEETIPSHRLIDPGRHQDYQVQESKGRDGDSGADEALARRAEQRVHGVGRWGAAAGQTRYAQRAEIRQVCQQVHGDHDADPRHQGARQVPLRRDQLLRHEIRLLPATEGKEDRDQGGTHRKQEPPTGERSELFGRRRRGSQREPGNDQDRERTQLQNREHILRDRPRLYSHIIDRGQQQYCADCERQLRRRTEADQGRRVAREGYRHGGNGAGGYHQQERPGIQECRQLSVGVAQIDIAAAGDRPTGAELSEHQRSQQRDAASQHPNRHGELDGPSPLGYQRRIEEDARADDAADHHHGPGEDSDASSVRARGRGRTGSVRPHRLKLGHVPILVAEIRSLLLQPAMVPMIATLPTRRLGQSDLHLSTVGFGAWAAGGGGWAFGWGPQNDADSIASIRRALEHGINWIDTAAVYGLGHSEEVVRLALEGMPAASRPYIFTKCGLVWDEAHPGAPPRQVLEPESIRRECEASLRRLGVERIDLYQFHWPDQSGTAVEDSWETMTRLVDEGKVHAVGVSNFDVALLERCEAVRHVDSLQPPLSLIRRQAAESEIPWCAAHGTGIIGYSPMQSGLLTERFSVNRIESLSEDDWRRRSPDFRPPKLSRNLALRDALRPIAQQHGTTVSAVAIAWTLAWPGVTGAIVGARSPDQVDGWIGAATLELTLADLDQIAKAVGQTAAGSGPALPK